jgi:hypothetical protein
MARSYNIVPWMMEPSAGEAYACATNMTSVALRRRPSRGSAGSIDTPHAARSYGQAPPAPPATRGEHPRLGRSARSTGHQDAESTYTRTAQYRAIRASSWRSLPLLLVAASQGCQSRAPSSDAQAAARGQGLLPTAPPAHDPNHLHRGDQCAACGHVLGRGSRTRESGNRDILTTLIRHIICDRDVGVHTRLGLRSRAQPPLIPIVGRHA